MKNYTNDTELLTAFQEGVLSAEKTVFDHFFQPLCLFSERITGDILQSEDIVAETFEKVMLRRGDFVSMAKLKSFLYQSVHNASINFITARKRHHVVHEQLQYLLGDADEGSDIFQAEMLRAELIHEIYKEIENLPEKCGQIFKMIFVEDLSTSEIAERLSINIQTVRSQKARAVQLIKTALLRKDPRLAVAFCGLMATVYVG